MNRWKVKTGLTEGRRGERDITIVLARYDSNNMQLERHLMVFCETDEAPAIAAVLRSIASQLETEAA